MTTDADLPPGSTPARDGGKRWLPWCRTIGLLGAAFAIYVSVAVLVSWAADDSIVGSAVAAVVVAGLALGYRRWVTGSVLAPDLVRGATARTTKFWLCAGLALVLCWVTGQVTSLWIYGQLGDPAFDAHNSARAATPVWLLVITSLLLSPLGEESIMRGIVYPALRRHWPVLPAALFSALAFALLHGNLVQIAVTLPLGVLLALVYEATLRLWPVVGMHAVFNFASLFTPRPIMESITSWPLVLGGTLATTGAIMTLFAIQRRTRLNHGTEAGDEAPTDQSARCVTRRASKASSASPTG